MKRLLILGASGLVGGDTLQFALADPRVERVIAPTRRLLPRHVKLLNPVAPDLDSLLPDATAWAVDAVICALGTTMAKAGSKAAFRHIDYDLPLAFAKVAHARGAETFALTSSMGASASSLFFYMRTKGELERDLARAGFQSFSIVRPGLISGDRNEYQRSQRLLLPLFGALAPILPSRFRMSRASRIAEVLLDSAVASKPGVHFVSAESLT